MRRLGWSTIAVLLLTLALAVAGCTPATRTPTPPAPPGEFRPVSTAALRLAAGEPTARESSGLRRGAEVWSYGSGMRYQVERDQAVARARAPIGPEIHPQYWNQRLAGRHGGWRPRTLGPHEEINELKASVAGVTVWWDPAADRVTRIWEYAPVTASVD